MLQSAARNVLSFAHDLWIATGAAALGAAAGSVICLGLAALEYGPPRSGDLRVVHWAVVFGLLAGSTGGLLLRSALGAIQNRQMWALGFLAFGCLAGPLGLIGLAAWVMANRPY